MSGDTEAWAALDRELDAWGAAGRTATLWWRDDDAVAPSPELDRLLGLAAASGAPLALAVIPAAAEDALAARLEGQAAEIAVLQHGCAHRNHAAAGGKKCELVDPAAQPGLPAELRRARQRLAELFGRRFLAVQVPPWNRIDPALLALLPGLGFTGLYTARRRPAPEPLPGLVQANCHLDILQWRPERRFLGSGAALDLLIDHLAARRSGAAESAEASGILSHHLVHDAAAWDFLAELLARLAAHPAARLLAAVEVFAGRRQRSALDRRT
jgi:hypothetical protein